MERRINFELSSRAYLAAPYAQWGESKDPRLLFLRAFERSERKEHMKNARWMTSNLALGIALATAPALGQAYAVPPSGGMGQQRPTSVVAIAPEDRATKDQLAKLFDAMRIREQVQAMRNVVPQIVESQLRQQMHQLSGADGSKMTPEQRAAADKIVAKYVEQSINIYPVDEMLADMSTIYQRYLTRQDVDALTAFYNSSVGQHLLDAQPKIAQEFMPLAIGRAEERSKVLTAEMMKDLNELKQSSKPAPASPPRK